MSKFFARAAELTSSESESDSDDDKQQQQQQTKAGTQKTGGTAPRKQYMKGFDDSDESEDDVRVMKTTKDKRLESLHEVIKDLTNHVKINDFSSLQTDFDKFSSEIEKSSNMLYEESGKDGLLPNYILRTFLKLDDAINEVTNEQKKKFSKTNSMAYNKLKQKLKKYFPTAGPSDNNFEQQLAKFRENPVLSEDERKAEKKTDKKKEEKKAPAKAKADDVSEEEEESEYDDEEESEESEESESSEEEEKLQIPREQMTPAQRRLKWVKKDRLPGYVAKDKIEKPKPTKDAKDTAAQALNALAGQQTDKEAKETILNLKNDFQIDFTIRDNVIKKLKDIQDERRKGKFDPRYHAQVLAFMLDQVKDTRGKIEIILNLLNALFDSAKLTFTGYMNRESWVLAQKQMRTLMTYLDTQPIRDSIRNMLTKKDVNSSQSVEGEDVDNQILDTSAEVEKSILPGIANYIEKLDAELLKAFQGLHPQKFEYLQRIRDENLLLQLSDLVLNYLAEFDENDKEARVAIVKLEHLYYRLDSLNQKIKDRIVGKENSQDIYIVEGDSKETVQNLVDLVNKYGSARMRVRATLYQIYHHSIHNRFAESKELLLKSHIGELIHLQDITNQILYNRAITQIGMAAFRLGMIEDSHEILVEICQSAKLREALAQGISRGIDKTLDLEKEELKRQIPFHMHINLQLLDCIYMISAMLLEIPNIAENQYSVNKRIISKNFKKMIDQYDSRPFYLAPENYRDNIVFAAKHLNNSNWRKAIEHIFSIKQIQYMIGGEGAAFKETLINKFKESAMKAFLCRGAKTYSSFSIESLVKLFDIPESKLNQIVSKMILRGKIQAYFDTQKSLLVLDKQSNEVNELQQLTLQYVDKLEGMIDNNERLIDMMTGGQLYGYRERSTAEINMINANKRNKILMKANAPTTVPSVGTTSGAQQMLVGGNVNTQANIAAPSAKTK